MTTKNLGLKKKIVVLDFQNEPFIPSIMDTGPSVGPKLFWTDPKWF